MGLILLYLQLGYSGLLNTLSVVLLCTSGIVCADLLYRLLGFSGVLAIL